MEKKVKCEEIGFEHCWKDVTPNIVYATNPPQYPPKQRECVNCGRLEIEHVIQREKREWLVSDGTA